MNEVMIKIESPITKAALSSTGWNLPENLSEVDWSQAGSFLVHVDQARQWWLGDWWNACKWGDGRQACEDVGIEYENARVCGHVCGKIQLLRRRNNLRFSHHREVCPIPEEALQDKLLDWAIDNKATVKQLREKVQAYMAMKDWAESEKQRRFDVESGLTVVANLSKDANLINWAKTEGLFVQVDRTTVWGNPFEIPGDGNRDEVCDSYEVYYRLKKSLHKKIKNLSGKVLGCHCYPERCHGNYLKDLSL